jgi:arylsulfatase A-like enzyme
LIVVDDMGLSDLGCFGGEIRTPHLDALAASGLRCTNFYTAPTCSPTRSMLLSGCDMHIAGVGNMDEMTAPNQLGKPGYEGVLSDRVVSVAALLKKGGYHTYMAGKWHLGREPNNIPAAKGFERDFTMLDGAGSYWSDRAGIGAEFPVVHYTHDGEYVKELPSDYYSSDYFTNELIDNIDENLADGQPFFAYLPFQAPHDPYGVQEDWRRRYKGKYAMGWDALRKTRLARMKEMGIVPEQAALAERMWLIPRWSDLAPAVRILQARKMELYAALVENLDYQVGRVMDHLKRTGEFDNTVIMFFSDNGAEGNDLAAVIGNQRGTRGMLFHAAAWGKTDPSAWGTQGSWSGYGPAWAQVSMTPLRLYKGWTAEGGIRAPFIAAGPGVNSGGRINHSITHVMDLAPTMLEIAGVKRPDTWEGRDLAPMQGKSLVKLFSAEVDSARGPEDWIGSELFGNRGIRQGDWKLLWLYEPMGKGKWELFNLADDPGERNDLAEQHPERVATLNALWEEYVETNGVILPDRHPYEKVSDLPIRVSSDPRYPPYKNRDPRAVERMIQEARLKHDQGKRK